MGRVVTHEFRKIIRVGALTFIMTVQKVRGYICIPVEDTNKKNRLERGCIEDFFFKGRVGLLKKFLFVLKTVYTSYDNSSYILTWLLVK